MHTKFGRLLSKSLTTLEVMTYYLAVHTGPVRCSYVVYLMFVITKSLAPVAEFMEAAFFVTVSSSYL